MAFDSTTLTNNKSSSDHDIVEFTAILKNETFCIPQK